MIIVDPSYEIQDELDRQPLLRALEARGRVCYKSEDKISEDSAIPFLSKIAASGHGSVLEMAVVTAEISCSAAETAALLATQPRFLLIDETEKGLLITASIRALRELAAAETVSAVAATLAGAVAAKYPFLFTGAALPPATLPPPRFLSIDTVEALPQQQLLCHRFLGVKFVVSRAVSHELVRHRPCSFLQESQRYCNYSQARFGQHVTFIRPLFYPEDSPEFARWEAAMTEAEAAYLHLLATSSPQAARTVLPNSCKTEIVVYCNLAEWRHIFKLRTSNAAEPSMREIMLPLQAELKARYSFL
ncbi:MAG: FAD-dependent thymidylate synthase [Desulfobulbaceae bacterium]|jgi:thymidylate synthase (FAD)|nr:FAD-dependent thymidylate synthase [Desulfobulbaceae bacterium]